MLQRHTSTFNYGQKTTVFHFWSHISKGNEIVDTIIFLGSGQTGRIAKWVAGNAPSGTVVVEGLPHKIADRNAHDLKEFAHNYTNIAFLTALTTFRISSANIVAESQAAPGAVWTALSQLAHVRNVTLISPLGLTAHILGDSPKQRLKELKRRAFLSTLQFAQSPLYDVRNLYLGSLMLHAVLFDARWNVSGQKYAVGASHDVRQECRQLAAQLHAKGNHLTLLLGKHDKLFPPDEVRASLHQAKLQHVTITVLQTSHASLAIRAGRQILREAIRAARR